MDRVAQTSFDGTGLHQLGKQTIQHHVRHKDETAPFHPRGTRTVLTHMGTSVRDIV